MSQLTPAKFKAVTAYQLSCPGCNATIENPIFGNDTWSLKDVKDGTYDGSNTGETSCQECGLEIEFSLPEGAL